MKKMKVDFIKKQKIIIEIFQRTSNFLNETFETLQKIQQYKNKDEKKKTRRDICSITNGKE